LVVPDLDEYRPPGEEMARRRGEDGPDRGQTIGPPVERPPRIMPSHLGFQLRPIRARHVGRVGYDEVKPLRNVGKPIGSAHLNPCFQAVVPHVSPRTRHGARAHVNGHHRYVRARLGHGQSKNPSSCPQVETERGKRQRAESGHGSLSQFLRLHAGHEHSGSDRDVEVEKTGLTLQQRQWDPSRPRRNEHPVPTAHKGRNLRPHRGQGRSRRERQQSPGLANG